MYHKLGNEMDQKNCLSSHSLSFKTFCLCSWQKYGFKPPTVLDYMQQICIILSPVLII